MTLQQIEGDPGFQELSFEEQREVRALWARDNLPTDSKFQQLDDQAKADVFHMVVNRRPALRQTTSLSRELMQLGDAVGQGQAVDRALVETKLIESWKNQGTFRRLQEMVAGSELFNASGAFAMPETPDTNDERKAYQYMVQQLATHSEDTAKKLRVAQNFGAIGGTIMDVVFNVAAAAPLTTTGAAAITASAQSGTGLLRTIASRGAFGNFLATQAVPATLTEGTESAFLTVSELMREKYNQEVAENSGFREKVLHTSALFGKNFAFDMLAWNAMKIGGRTLRVIGRNFQPRGWRGSEQVADVVDLEHGVQAIMTDIPREVLEVMEPATRKNISRLKETFALAERMARGELVDETVAKRLVINSLQYDVDDVAGKIRLTGYDVKDGADSLIARTVGDFADYNAALKAAITDVNQKIGKLSVEAADEVGRVRTITVLEQTARSLKGTGTKTATMDALRRVSANPQGILGRKPVAETVFELQKKYPSLRKVQIDVREIPTAAYRKTPNHVVELPDVAGKKHVSLLVPGGKVTDEDVLRVRRDVGLAVQHSADVPEEVTAELTEAFRKLNLETVGGKTKIKATNIVRKYLKDQPVLDAATGKPIKNLSKHNGALIINNKQFDNIEHAAAALTVSDLSMQKQIARELGRRGLQLEPTKKPGNFRIRRGKQIVLYGGTDGVPLERILYDDPSLLPKEPIRYLQQDVIYDYSKETMTVTDEIVHGHPEDVAKYLEDNYKASRKTVRKTQNGSVEYAPGDPRFLVTIDDVGYTRHFTSLEEAKAFVRSGIDTVEKITDVAAAKGIHVGRVGEGFILHAPGKPARIVTTMADAKRIIKETPMNTDAVQELAAEIPESYRRYLEDTHKELFREDLGLPQLNREYELMKHVRKTKFRGRLDKMWRVKLNTYIGLYDQNIKMLSEVIQDDEMHEVLYRQLFQANSLLRGKASELQRIIDRTFAGAKKSDLELISRMLETAPNKWNDIIPSEYGVKEITGKHREMAEAARKYLRDASEVFGIEGEEFLFDYLPRIRKFTLSEEGVKHHYTSGSADFVRAALKKNVGDTPMMKFFAENARTADLQEMATERNIKEVLMRYTSLGLRNVYLKGAVKNATEYINKLAKEGNVDESLLRYITGAVTDLSHGMQDLDKMLLSEGISDAMRTFFKKSVPELSQRAADHYVHVMRSASTAAMMGFKPWMQIRNSQQIWSTLAPRMGNSWVAQAMEDVLDDPQGIMRWLIQNGHVTGKGVFMDAVEGGKSSGLLHRLNRYGMLWHKNSDDYTRAVAARAAQLRYDKALRDMTDGVIDQKQFVKASGIEMMHPQDAKNILKFSEVGDHTTARDLFAKQLIDETMGTYVDASNPLIFKGTMFQRFFGMYGHYSIMFRENVARMMSSHISTGEKMLTVGRAALNWASLWFAFEKMLGIRASAFSPWTQSTFSGGPYFQLLAQTLMATDSGYRGQIARSDLAKQYARQFAPFASVFSSWSRGMDLIDRGHAAEGIGQLFTLPMLDPDRPTAR